MISFLADNVLMVRRFEILDDWSIQIKIALGNIQGAEGHMGRNNSLPTISFCEVIAAFGDQFSDYRILRTHVLSKVDSLNFLSPPLPN